MTDRSIDHLQKRMLGLDLSIHDLITNIYNLNKLAILISQFYYLDFQLNVLKPIFLSMLLGEPELKDGLLEELRSLVKEVSQGEDLVLES